MTTRTRTEALLTFATVAMAIIGLTTASANAGQISYVRITSDADCGISSYKTYTHKLDFGRGSPGTLINGVQFDAYNAGANGTLNFSRAAATGGLSDHAGNANHNVSGGLVNLLTDMYYNGNNEAGGTTTWTLSGLTAGQTYRTRIYTRQWGASDSRLATFVFDPDGAGPVSDSTQKINQDDATTVGFPNPNDAYYINYEFTAVAGEDLVITLTQDIFNYSWHLYGITNELPVTKAYSPAPKDGAFYEGTWASLGWSPGAYAVSHNVYLGDNFDDVNNDDGTGPTFRGSQPLASTTLFVGFFGAPYPDGLVPGTTYYWRVDEVNDADPNSPWKGDVWSFRIPPTNAYDPSPATGRQFVDTDVTLTWIAGMGAKLHYVVFGDNFDDVNNAAAGTLSPTTTFTPGTLELGKTYYWRVDESNPPNPTVKGDVWSFTTLPEIPVTDPNLVAWWNFDEGEGNAAHDWSGHGNHGTFVGDPQWADGQDGGALKFAGNGDYVSINFSPELSANDFTVSAWVNVATEPGTYGILGTRVGSDNTFDVKVMATEIHGDIGSGSAWIDTSIDIEDHTGSNGQSGDLAVDAWYLVTYVIDNAGQQVRLYLDGDLKRTITISGTPLLMQAGQSMRIGHTGAGSEWMNGLMDDVRIYNKALTTEEIQLVMRGDLARAWNASPANNGISDVLRASSVSWSAGDSASQHAVYYGTDKDAVAVADTSDTTGVFRGLQTTTNYTPPEGVEWGGGPYFWRVDEHNTDGTITGGPIWSFSVADYIPVEDFESYNDIESGQPGSNLVYETWADGYGVPTNGSTMGYTVPFEPTMETDTVHGGRQSAPLGYDNTSTALSEVTRNLTPQDWTVQGIQTLTLWFNGTPGNTGQLYVKINDAKVTYDGAASDIALAQWQVWNVDLSAAGANLQNVSKLAIGVEGAGASGLLLIDDIRLYPRAGELIVPVLPDNTNLAGKWNFEEGSGSVISDSSGNGNNGIARGGPMWVAGSVGNGALSFDGIDSFVEVPDDPSLDIEDVLTISAWVNLVDISLNSFFVTKNPSGTAPNNYPGNYELRTEAVTGRLQLGHQWATGTQYVFYTSDGALSVGEWQHVAVTLTEGDAVRFYIDAVPVGTAAQTQPFGIVNDNPVRIGTRMDEYTFLNGMMDDVRIYERALSAEEIAGLAGRTAPMHKPF